MHVPESLFIAAVLACYNTISCHADSTNSCRQGEKVLAVCLYVCVYTCLYVTGEHNSY